MKKWIIALLIIGWIGSLYFSYKWRPSQEIIRQTDTLWYETVLRDSFPVPVYVEKLRYVIDTLFSVDSVFIPVEIPIERKEYETPDYKAVIEGYRANLLSMEVYQRTQVITNTDTRYIKTKPSWGIGVQVGYGIIGKEMSPYIGIGIQYNVLTF